MKTANFPIKKFQTISEKKPSWSSWTCFCEAIKNKKSISDKTIKKYFDALVDKNDYEESSKKTLLNYLYGLAGNLEKPG